MVRQMLFFTEAAYFRKLLTIELVLLVNFVLTAEQLETTLHLLLYLKKVKLATIS